MTEKVYGYINFPDKIDITDPCYDEDVWCRVNNFPIEPGLYECYAIILSNKESGGFGKRVARCGIRLPHEKAKHYEEKAIIGVDAGLAGFFNCNNVKVFDDILERGSVEDIYFGENYFFTSSGYGDGTYGVYAGYSDNGLVEVYIKFI